MNRTKDKHEQRCSLARIQTNTQLIINQLLLAQSDDTVKLIKSISGYLSEAVGKDYAVLDEIGSSTKVHTSEQRIWVNSKLKKSGSDLESYD